MPSAMDFTTGNIRKALIRFSIPFFLTSLIQSLYNIADIMVVGRYCGNEGIAAASIAGSLTSSIIFMIISLCNGGAIMTAQYAGKKSGEDIRETVSSLFSMMLILAVFVTVVSLLLANPLLRALNTPPEAFAGTARYYTVCMAGSVFVFGYNAMASALQGLGDSRTPMYFSVGSCLLNIGLDVLFVGALGMDVAGAAIATVISQAAAMIGLGVYLWRAGFFADYTLGGVRLIPKKAAMILKLGLPGALQSLVVSGGFLMVSSITNSLGVSAASGVAVASKINNICQMPAGAIGSATSSMVGQNVGGKNYDRARSTLKNAIGISLAVGLVAFAVVQAAPMPLLRLLADDEDVLAHALPYLRVTALDYLLVALVFPLNALCNGSGHTIFTMIPSFVSSVVARIPVAYFCVRALNLGMVGIAISTPTGTLSAILICAAYYYSNRWCKEAI